MRNYNRLNIYRRPGRALAVIGLLTATVLPTVVAAQTSPADSVRDTTHSQKQAPFFTRRDVILAGLFAGATVFAAPFDRHVALQLQDSGAQANRLFKNSATGVELIASPGAYIIGGSLYAVGR